MSQVPISASHEKLYGNHCRGGLRSEEAEMDDASPKDRRPHIVFWHQSRRIGRRTDRFLHENRRTMGSVMLDNWFDAGNEYLYFKRRTPKLTGWGCWKKIKRFDISRKTWNIYIGTTHKLHTFLMESRMWWCYVILQIILQRRNFSQQLVFTRAKYARHSMQDMFLRWYFVRRSRAINC